MTKKELLEALKDVPDDMRVLGYDSEWGDFYDVAVKPRAVFLKDGSFCGVREYHKVVGEGTRSVVLDRWEHGVRSDNLVPIVDTVAIVAKGGEEDDPEAERKES
jgi:hypothetical protein